MEPPADNLEAPFAFQGVVRLTRAGSSYLIFTLAIGFAALNTGNNALYIAFTFMLGCLLLSGLASKGGLKHLDIRLVASEEVWAGRESEGRLHIANDSRIWNVRDVIVVSPELVRPVLIPLVNRRSAIVVRIPFVFRRRGRIELRHLDFYTRYPFGFFLKKRRVKISSEVIVFPRIAGGESARERFRPIEGEQSNSNKIGPGSEIHSFRDYVRGDSLRHVYWKKSAGVGRWIMKQTESENARAVHVIVDNFRPAEASEDDFEQMVSQATTFIHHASRRGLDVLVTMPRHTFRLRAGESASPVYRELALLEGTHDPISLHVDRNTVLFSVRRHHDAA